MRAKTTVFDTGYRACVPDRGVGEKVSAMSSSRKLRRHRKRAGTARARPWLLAVLCYSLRTFLDLGYVIRYEPVSLPVDRLRRFFVWGFG